MAAEIQITDKDGWRKTFVLDKNIVHVGADPANDVVLESWRGSGVALRHLQMLRLAQDSGAAYRLVNLGDAELRLRGENERVVSSHSMEDISGGDSLRLGDFTLVFRMQADGPLRSDGAQLGPAVVDAAAPAAAAVTASPLRSDSIQTKVPDMQGGVLSSADVWTDQASSTIGLSLSLEQTDLDPDMPLEGKVTIRNLGQQTGVQFRLELDGLDPECYTLGPGLILFPNAEREMQLVLHHPRRPSPPAGKRRIAVRATAPVVYPGERAVVSVTVDIKPFYDQRLRVVESEQRL